MKEIQIQTRQCSFCGQSQAAAKLLAGPTVYICYECVGKCNDLIGERGKGFFGVLRQKKILSAEAKIVGLAIEKLQAVQSDLASLENEEVRITSLRLAEWFIKNELVVDEEDDEPGSILWTRVNAYRRARLRAKEKLSDKSQDD